MSAALGVCGRAAGAGTALGWVPPNFVVATSVLQRSGIWQSVHKMCTGP